MIEIYIIGGLVVMILLAWMLNRALSSELKQVNSDLKQHRAAVQQYADNAEVLKYKIRMLENVTEKQKVKDDEIKNASVGELADYFAGVPERTDPIGR